MREIFDKINGFFDEGCCFKTKNFFLESKELKLLTDDPKGRRNDDEEEEEEDVLY